MDFKTMETKNNNNHENGNLRDKSLEWFFGLNEVEKLELKEKCFHNTHIAYNNKWVFNFTLGQIEEMYQKSVK